MTEKDWQFELQRLEAEAFRKLVTFASAWTQDSGYTTAKHVVDYIKRLETKVCETVGDCPDN